MSPHCSMPDEPPHPKTLLRAVEDQLSPEVRALFARMCDQLEHHDVRLTRIEEQLDAYQIRE